MTENKRRICLVLVIDDLGWGGAERQVVELANNIDRNRFDVHICSLSDHLPLSKQLKDFENNLHVIARRNRFDFTVVPRLARLLRKIKADIVHGYLFSAEIASRLAGCIAGTSVIIGSERNANQVFRRSNILIYSITSRCVKVIIANSHTGAVSNSQVLRRPISDYRVVHNGIDTGRFRPNNGAEIRQRLGIPLQSPVVGAFANFKIQKNHSMLFRAFRLVLGSLPDTRLLLVGQIPTDSRGRLNDYKAQLDCLVDDLGIRHQCIFLGHRKDVEHLYSACDITVLPSIHEGSPNVLLESMACGVPVIATNICDNKYIVEEGEAGYLVEMGDYEAMSDRMKILLCNKALQQKMGQNARSWVIKEFSTSRLAAKMEAVYLELLSKKN